MFQSHFSVIILLAWRGLKQHAFSSFVAAFTISMAGGLFLSTWKIKEEAQKAFVNSSGGFDAVLGARGSKLQLILNAMFHLEASPGNLSWEQYELIRDTRGVKEAYPIAVGDNYHGYRLVGTLPELFQQHEWKTGRKYEVQGGGRIFSADAKEALVGDFVARKLGLSVRSKFHPYHGLDFDEKKRHEDTYVVVGVLEPTGTPADKVIWIPIKGIQKMEGHDPAAAQSVSAVLLVLRGAAGFQLDMKYNKQGNQATLAWPVAATLASFFDKLSWFEDILALVAFFVALVGALIVFATLRTVMHEKKREYAILRCLGASRLVVTCVVLAQSLLLSLTGALGAYLAYGGIGFTAAHLIREQTGVVMDPWSLDLGYLAFFPIVIVLGFVSGLIPALQAYRSSLSENLSPKS
ncbi:MAG: ABC transporter permease [Opitutae bacterium]|nr:ABC transporter permease [Opitutae bacterium]